MSFCSKAFISAVFAATFLAIPAFSQTATVQGSVKGADGKMVDGAVIAFDRMDSKGHVEIKSDKRGNFQGIVQTGKYDITLSIGGKPADKLPGVQIGSGANPPIDFDLAAPPKAGAAPSKEDEAKVKEREAQLAKNKELNDSFATGRAALEAKRWDDAIASLSKAAEIGPTQAAVWAALADAYSGAARAAKGADAQPLFDKSFDAFKKLIELKPTDAGNFNNYALALAADKKMDDAKINLAKAVELDPANAGKYHYNLGALLMNSNQPDGAVEEFKKAIDSDPNYAEAYFYYGSTLVGKATLGPDGKMQAPAGTVEALQKYLALKPDGPNAASAKDLIAALGASVATNYKDPNAPAPKGAKKK